MWRIALSGLKTEELVTKYMIPGAKGNRVFCDARVLETIEDLFVNCKALYSIRDIAIVYHTLFYLTVPNGDCDAM